MLTSTTRDASVSEEYSGAKSICAYRDTDSSVHSGGVDGLTEPPLTWTEFAHVYIPALIASHLDCDGAAWNLQSRMPWLVVEPSGYRSRTAGWKLHLSCTATSATDVLGAAVPVLVRHRVATLAGSLQLLVLAFGWAAGLPGRERRRPVLGRGVGPGRAADLASDPRRHRRVRVHPAGAAGGRPGAAGPSGERPAPRRAVPGGRPTRPGR